MSTEKKPLSMPPLVAAKLKAFEQIRADFEESFQYAQEVHGQRRFDSFPVPAVVRYLHALWICDCKDQLLSVPRTIERYEGPRALALLLAWQEGDSAGVIEFLQAKLDMLPFGQITQQMREEALAQRSDPAWVARLAHGRRVLLNRGMNLYQALDAIFVLSPDPLIDAVRSACARHGHLPEQIREQWASLETPLYAMLRHQALAQRNMLVMNALGVRVTDNGADRPGQRTERVALPTMPAGPYAQQIIIGAVEMTPPAHSTYRYIPAEEMRQVILNDSLAPADLTSESEQHPPMS